MIRCSIVSNLHVFVQINTIPQRDKHGYYNTYKCIHCKLVGKVYMGTVKIVLPRRDKRVGDCIERRKYPDRFRLWDWKCNWKLRYDG